jgi:outer membrane receptor for ferrienterochelin and colicins
VDWQPNDQWSFNTTARYSGLQYTNVPANGQNMLTKAAYTVADLSVGYRIDKHFSVRAGVLNLTDQNDNRNQSTDFNEDGRRYFMSLSADF